MKIKCITFILRMPMIDESSFFKSDARINLENC